MRILRVVAAPLLGESPPGGWSAEIRPEDSIHTLIAVHTDAGITGFGSVFTDGRLVQAALAQLEPLLLGENALEPGRVSEKLHQNTFWFGRGGSITHAISGVDIALWDILGKVTGLPVSILAGGRHRSRVRPYCSVLMQEPAEMADVIAKYRDQGFRAFKIGWGPFGRRDDAKLDEAIVAAAASQLPADGKLMVDAGASDAYWTNGLKWALRTADMLAAHDVALVRGSPGAGCARGFRDPAPGDEGADRRRRGSDPAAVASFPFWRGAPSTSCNPTSPRSAG